MSPQTVLIGLDGATFTILTPLMEQGVMPFLRQFQQQGVRAVVRSVTPPLTPPAWASVMTGKLPGQHGVFDFFQREGSESHHLRFVTAEDVGTETLWTLASRHGRRVMVLNFPLTFPPPPVNGCLVPGGWVPWRQLRLGCYPPGLFDRLRALPGFNARELVLDMALEARALEGCAPEEYLAWIDLHIRREQRWGEVLQALVRTEAPDLVAVLFDGLDKIQHLCWRFLDPALASTLATPWEQAVAARCRDYFRQLDALLATCSALADPAATVFLVSDHGFGPARTVWYLNIWLEQHGYLTWAPTADQSITTDPQLGFRAIARHLSYLDWHRTVAYAPTPTGHGLYLVRRRPDGGVALTEDEYQRQRQALAAALRAARHPATGQPLVTAVATREEVFAGPYQDRAPDLVLSLAPGTLISILRGPAAVVERAEVVGTHHPEGVFLAAGPGLRAGVQGPSFSLVDVAPLVLHSLDLPVPEDMAGRVPPGLYRAEFLRHRPVRRGPASVLRPAPPTAGARLFDAEAEATMLARLRALGYIE
jgi:predicted AlkP superfamily phosphohydrolase/phosphomutase